MATWTALIKHHIEDRTLNWRHVYHVLELEDPDAFASRMMQENQKAKWAMPGTALHRRTGRSTQIQAKAIAHAMNGWEVYLGGAGERKHEQRFIQNTLEMLELFRKKVGLDKVPMRGNIRSRHDTLQAARNMQQSYVVLIDSY
jgi:hypothetical protein